MTSPLEIQMILPGHEAAAVYHALTQTQALKSWFAEHADVDLQANRYAFWGKYTPSAPNKAAGQHQVIDYTRNQQLAYRWIIDGIHLDINYRLLPMTNGTRLYLTHTMEKHPPSMTVGFEDFWFLSLENLRRHLDGKTPVLLDYTSMKLGDFEVSVEIDGEAAAVFHTLTDNDALERWIASQANVEPKIGGTYDVGWGDGGPIKIVDLVPNAKLAYSWEPYHTYPETVTTWTLKESGGKTRLTMVHSGFNPDDDAKGLIGGWLNFLSWVKSIIEYGDAWHPAVKKLNLDLYKYYPASMVQRQHLFE